VYYDSTEDTVVILNRNGARPIPVHPGGQIGFRKAATDDSIVLTLSSTDGGQVFSAVSEIYCLNMDNGHINGVAGSASGEAIMYTTNSDYISSNEAPLATLTVNTPKSIEIDISKNIRTESTITKITSQGSLNASLTVNSGRIIITLPSSPSKNSTIVFNAGIYGLDPSAYATYTYTLTYNDKNGTWELTQ